MVKFIYSEKAAKFCEIFPLFLTVCTVVKTKGKISQNFVAFSEYMNFNLMKNKNSPRYDWLIFEDVQGVLKEGERVVYPQGSVGS